MVALPAYHVYERTPEQSYRKQNAGTFSGMSDVAGALLVLAAVLTVGCVYCCVAVVRMLNEHTNERRKDYAGLALAEAFDGAAAEDEDAEPEADK